MLWLAGCVGSHDWRLLESRKASADLLAVVPNHGIPCCPPSERPWWSRCPPPTAVLGREFLVEEGDGLRGTSRLHRILLGVTLAGERSLALQEAIPRPANRDPSPKTRKRVNQQQAASC